jgi:hypothetical protein
MTGCFGWVGSMIFSMSKASGRASTRRPSRPSRTAGRCPCAGLGRPETLTLSRAPASRRLQRVNGGSAATGCRGVGGRFRTTRLPMSSPLLFSGWRVRVFSGKSKNFAQRKGPVGSADTRASVCQATGRNSASRSAVQSSLGVASRLLTPIGPPEEKL